MVLDITWDWSGLEGLNQLGSQDFNPYLPNVLKYIPVFSGCVKWGHWPEMGSVIIVMLSISYMQIGYMERWSICYCATKLFLYVNIFQHIILHCVPQLYTLLWNRYEHRAEDKPLKHLYQDKSCAHMYEEIKN